MKVASERSEAKRNERVGKGKDILRLDWDLSGDVLALHVRNDLAIPTKAASERSEMKRNETKREGRKREGRTPT